LRLQAELNMKDALKYIRNGLIGIFACFMVGKFFMIFGWIVIACFATITFGILWPVISGGNKRASGNSMVIGVFGIIFSGIVPALFADYKGAGFSRNNISINDVKQYSLTTFFTFTDAQVEDDYSGYRVLAGRSGKTGEIYVAPVVSKDWDKTREIIAWTVSDAKGEKTWKKNCRAALQKVENHDARKAIKKTATRYGLKTNDDAVLLYWTCDPIREWKYELKTGIGVPIFISVVWIIISLASFNYKEQIVEDETE